LCQVDDKRADDDIREVYALSNLKVEYRSVIDDFEEEENLVGRHEHAVQSDARE